MKNSASVIAVGADGGDAEGPSAGTAHDRFGAPVECRHYRLRQKLQLLRRRVMALHLALKSLYRGLALTILRDHRKHAADRILQRHQNPASVPSICLGFADHAKDCGDSLAL